ncbi:MAG: 2-C-methyl-D-erythritol 2,4-cyclodiphosphate synthase [Candidatus Omnitrophica bacterium]|nr:2-C-methyl-D-erythritol 2,4-cyclodiphosphate synthase [Candidatus Omnitrophota bacterium]MCM8809319.1 2-C-methyl-D-erythritol 2,4-cyclodiphosphate synthase [Candidatus Omnitrophota bacterium]MCM8810765.1 2-C-methyl-D-erythritol 2,4-cyclodiphosphate synthase [Candidatus Omnitrophota bacterium]
MFKTGIGFDIHKFKKGRKFILGGIEIPYEKGLLGHSDGDVLIHSISDAILGALGRPDIGYYFPDTDEKIKGIDSKKILEKVIEFLKKDGYKIVNIDNIIICERPKILPYIEKIKANLSSIIDIEKDKIGIKSKTTEAIDKGNYCACLSIVLIEKIFKR